MKRTVLTGLGAVIMLVLTSMPACASGWSGPSAREAFDKPNLHSEKDLYRMAREAMASGHLEESRLFALRLFFDGNRSQNLLNLLGIIELQAEQPLLAAEWLRRASALSLSNKVAQRYLSRLPQSPRPIPVDQTRLAEHFNEISESLPRLLERLVNPKLHSGAILKALERGQVYLALALAEEYEKKYQGPDGPALTSLCAWYLGRNRDAGSIIDSNLKKAPYHPLLLFVRAMISDSNPGSSSGSFFRALYDLDQWSRALSLVDQFSKANPTSPDAFITQARIMLDLNKTKEAGQALQEAGMRDPGNPEIELLWVAYLLQRGEKDKAATRLSRAFRRGYNLPSVSLTAALFALQNGRMNEVNVILNDAASSRPFSDPEAYSVYITLSLLVERTADARSALDEWRSRITERSMACYLEAFYCFKMGDNRQALSWLRKGFQQNPNRIGILQFLLGFPALADDLQLFAEINNRLAAATVSGYSEMPVPETLPAQATGQPQAGTAVAGSSEISGDGKFQISLGSGIDPSARTVLGSELGKMYERIAAYIGELTVPIFINFISAEGVGPTIALYEPTNTVVTVTGVYYDAEMIRNIIMANLDNLSDNEMGPLIEELPGHILASELTRLIIQILVPEARTDRVSTAWMQRGLAEVLAASTISQRYRLLVAQKSIGAGTAKLVSGGMLNSIFSEGYTSPAVFETATAQSYLMTCFLIKRTGSLERGCRDMMRMIQMVSKGTDFAEAVNQIFKISETDFETYWKESAYFALQQGLPYEW